MHTRSFAIFTAFTLFATVRPCAAGPEPAAKRIPVQTESLNTTHQLIGPLGRPVGEVFTVDLTLKERLIKGYFEYEVKVTAIDSVTLKKPVVMPARLWSGSDIKELHKNTPYRVRVYQDAGMIDTPWEVLEEMKQTATQSTGHQFACWLTVLKPTDETKK